MAHLYLLTGAYHYEVCVCASVCVYFSSVDFLGHQNLLVIFGNQLCPDVRENKTMVKLCIFWQGPCQGAVHILRQPPEGGEGVKQMLTIADEGGGGGKPNADNCWRRG